MEQNMPKILTFSVITASIFIYTAVYNISYFFAIDLRLITLLQFTDYVSNAMNWLPVFFIILIMIAIMIISDANTPSNKQEISNNTNNKLRFYQKKLFRRIFYISFYSTLLFVFYYANSNIKSVIFMTTLIFGYITFAPKSTFLKVIKNKYGRLASSNVHAIGLIVILTAFQGYIAAKEDLKSTETNYYLPSDLGESVVFIRYLTGGLLIRRIGTNTIELIGHDGNTKLIYKLPTLVSDTDNKE